jgi:hypothetical protein
MDFDLIRLPVRNGCVLGKIVSGSRNGNRAAAASPIAAARIRAWHLLNASDE